MKKNNFAKVRQVTIEDYTVINDWYKQRKEQQPKSSILPNNGLNGFVVEKGGNIVAVIYLYLTNSKMGYFDFLMSDPNYKEKDRYELIMKLFQYCTKMAIASGIECVFVTTAIPGVIDKMKELGARENLICEAQKRISIYTYQEGNQIFLNI